jgi:hypothetical protein
MGQVLNTVSTDYVLVATFPDVPVGGSSRIDQPNPGFIERPGEVDDDLRASNVACLGWVLLQTVVAGVND